MIRVFIVEDQKTIQQLLKSYLEIEPDIEIIGAAFDGKAAIERLEEVETDVVLMDIEMPVLDGISATKTIVEKYPQLKVLILSIHNQDKYLSNAIAVGAKGYLLKDTPPQELVSAIRNIDKGYSQFGPGLLEKVNPELAIIRQELEHGIAKKPDNGLKPSFLNVFGRSPVPSSLKRYLGLGAFLNGAVWLLALSYFKFTPPVYTSEWGLKILETNSGVEVSIPDVGQASSGSKGWTPPSDRDTRNDYVYIATSPAVLEIAAERLDMSVNDLNEPEITVDEENGIMVFAIEGDSPDEAREQAEAFNFALTQQIQNLRDNELQRQEKEKQATLEEARLKLNEAQLKLSRYQAASGINAEEQVNNLASNIEQLRRQQAEFLAQQEGLSDRYADLTSSQEEVTPAVAKDAYQLQADPVYQQYLDKYAQAKRGLSDALAIFTPQHPTVIDRQEEVEAAKATLQQHASSSLGRPVDIDNLVEISPLSLDPQTQVTRQTIFNNRADLEQITAQNQELEKQLAKMETRLQNMSQEKFNVDRLKRDLQVAEAIFTATLAKLDFGRENIYNIYPPLQLVSQPDLPDEPSSPSFRSVALGGLAGSFLVTTGLVLLWFDSKRFALEPTQPSEPVSSISVTSI